MLSGQHKRPYEIFCPNQGFGRRHWLLQPLSAAISQRSIISNSVGVVVF